MTVYELLTTNFMSRVSYAVHSIQSASWLVGSCTDAPQIEAIMQRAQEMVSNVWTCEYKVCGSNPGRIQFFWDSVAGSLNQMIVHSFQARFGDDVNPPGEAGNVQIHFKPNPMARILVMRLALNDRLSSDDYQMLCEKHNI